MSTETETVSVSRVDLDTLIRACLRYLPGIPDGPDPELQAAFSRLDDARHEPPAPGESRPGGMPPGRYGRVEIPGYRENEGWISEETRFGLQVAVVRDRDGAETAAVGVGPLCRVVWLPVPELGPEPEPRRALPAGGWDSSEDPDGDELLPGGPF